MPAFRYEAATADGRVQSGVLEADSARHARATLRARSLLPLQVEPARDGGAVRRRLPAGRLPAIARQLASLVAAGLPLEQALDALVEEAERAPERELLAAVRASLVAGSPLSGALGEHARDFPEVFRALVRAGEESGSLPYVLERLATHLEARQQLAQRIAAALAYPAVVALVALAAITGLLVYVVPQVVGVFSQTHQVLPLPTRALLAIATVAGHPAAWAVGATVLTAAAFLLSPRSPFVEQRDALLLRLPVVGSLLKATEAARVAGTLATLVGGGVSLLRALDAARQVATNRAVRRAIGEAARWVEEGSALSAALRSAGRDIFPPVLLYLVAGGEASGELARMLDRASTQLARDVERRLLLAASVFEPLVVLAAGALVLFLVLAVMMPILEINLLVR